MIRQPIITVLGHVDHGKTSMLDYIRGSAIAAREAGAITQHIGATEIPIDVIKKICGNLLEKFKIKFTIPGLLMIDTPGHEAFTNLRKRGGSIADLAIVVIDINQGIQPQTKEAIEILKTFKVPFVVAANKIDSLMGWKQQSKIFIENFDRQLPATKEHFDSRFYSLVGKLSELGFDSDLYTRVDDYRKKIAIIPVSAKTGEGIAELIALLTGLAQRFLEGKLEINTNQGAKGTVLEIKEEQGMGMTADVIIYDGTISVGDILLIGGLSDVVETKVRSLFKPLPLVEIRDARKKFANVKSASAATGVKVVALNIDKAVSGAPLRSAKTKDEADMAREDISQEIHELEIELAESGIIIKTDTLGSYEAILYILKKQDVNISKIGIGNITKSDVYSAVAIAEKNELDAFVLGFNVSVDEDAQKIADEKKIPIITNKVIYKLIEDYNTLLESKKKLKELRDIAGLVWPCKFKILPGHVFRASNPAIFGVEILAGKLRPKVDLMLRDGKEQGTLKTIEDQGKKIEEAIVGQQVAISVTGLAIGRTVNESNELFVAIPENVFRKFKARKELLTKAEIDVLREIAEIKRKDKEMWGL